MLKKSIKPNLFVSTWAKVFKILAFLVNIVTYLVMCLGAFKAVYYCFNTPRWEQLALTVVLTLFAIYINLKNPNN